MNKNISKIASGALLLLASMATTSCVDGNDWEVDESYSRLFSVTGTSFSVSPLATEATVKWTNTPGTEYYVLELSKDSLYDEGPAGTQYGADQSIKASPYVLTDIDSDSKYFIRIKAISAGAKESNWTYLDGGSFKTKAEQIMFSVGNTDKTDKSVTVSWEADKAVTKIVILKGSNKEGKEVAVERPLTADEKTAGKATVDGLAANTTYTACVYNNDVRRGYATFTTYQEAPAADHVLYLGAKDVLSNAYLAQLAKDYPGESFTIALAGDATYEIKSEEGELETLKIPDGMAVNFYGLPGEKKTTIKTGGTSFAIDGTHKFIKFINLDLGNGINYIINQSAACSVDEIVFDDCTITNLANTIFRLQGDQAKPIGKLTVNNCICTKIGTSSYSFIHFEKGGVVNDIAITKSTINTQGTRCFISTGKLNMTGQILISNTTLYNIGGSGGRQFIDFGDTSHKPDGGINFVNSIFAKTQADDYRGVRAAAAPTVDNTYITSDWYQVSSGVVTGYTKYGKTAAELFEDPANGNFKIKDSSFRAQVGDPRWLVEE